MTKEEKMAFAIDWDYGPKSVWKKLVATEDQIKLLLDRDGAKLTEPQFQDAIDFFHAFQILMRTYLRTMKDILYKEES